MEQYGSGISCSVSLSVSVSAEQRHTWVNAMHLCSVTWRRAVGLRVSRRCIGRIAAERCRRPPMLRSVFVVAVSLDGDGIAHACVADAWDIQENAFVRRDP